MQQQLLQIITQQFGLNVIRQYSSFLPQEFIPTGHLADRLERGIDLIHPKANERMRAEVIVAPVLLHLALTCELSLFSGDGFNAGLAAGLSGTVDHLFSRAAPEQLTIQPPITAVVETKSTSCDDMTHCLVQMIASQRWNAYSGVVYGVVTTGLTWRFLRLKGTTVSIDRTEYPLFPIRGLLAFLAPMVSQNG